MTICRFWQQGNCRNGDSCRFEHPGAGRQQDQQSRRNNPFEALNYDSPGHARNPGGGSTVTQNQPSLPYRLNIEEIRKDVGEDRPVWILSCYGPGKDAPVQLFGGQPREQSFEEMRLRYYELAALGQQQQAVNEEAQLIANASQQMRNAMDNTQAAVNYIIEGANKHPNRHDLCRDNFSSAVNGFGLGANANTTREIGISQVGGAPKGPAGSTPFGTTPNKPAFGTPSFGASGFAAQSPPSGPAVNPFGQQKVAQQQPAFGTTSQPVNPFSQPSPAQVNNSSPFGQPAQSVSPFGQPSTTQPPQRPNPFSQSSAIQPEQRVNPFGPPAPSPFNASGNAVSAPSGPANPFSHQPTQQDHHAVSTGPTNPFARSSPAAVTPANPFAATASPTAMQNGINGNISYSNANGSKGPLVYRDNEPYVMRPGGRLERVWFPNGKQWNKPEDLPLERYDSALEESYKYMMEHGSFKDGIMPELPPKREWTSWDF